MCLLCYRTLCASFCNFCFFRKLAPTRRSRSSLGTRGNVIDWLSQTRLCFLGEHDVRATPQVSMDHDGNGKNGHKAGLDQQNLPLRRPGVPSFSGEDDVHLPSFLFQKRLRKHGIWRRVHHCSSWRHLPQKHWFSRAKGSAQGKRKVLRKHFQELKRCHPTEWIDEFLKNPTSASPFQALCYLSEATGSKTVHVVETHNIKQGKMLHSFISQESFFFFFFCSCLFVINRGRLLLLGDPT